LIRDIINSFKSERDLSDLGKGKLDLIENQYRQASIFSLPFTNELVEEAKIEEPMESSIASGYEQVVVNTDWTEMVEEAE
jgi:hypothetical protein